MKVLTTTRLKNKLQYEGKPYILKEDETMELTTILDAVTAAKGLVDSEVYADILEKYRAEDFRISEMVHRKLAASAVRLFNAVMSSPVSNADEGLTAAIYLLVCVDCMKVKLDIIRFEADSGIPTMRLKYILGK